MTDCIIRKECKVGRITLDRPQALNAMTYDMCLAIDAALIRWADDPDVAMVILDAVGEKAFCAGGDIAEMYATGIAGDYAYGRRFWRDEYRMNARLFTFPKPVASFLQGFTMGGGVGIGCHASHRVVGDTSRIAMPECTIGLVPDVGGSLILAQAPGRLGEYLGLTGDRMAAGDAIHCCFADYYIPEEAWPDLIAALTLTGDWTLIDAAAQPAPDSRLAGWRSEIDKVFGGERLGDIYRAVPDSPSEPIAHALRLMSRNAPLAMAVGLEIIRRVRQRPTIENALDQEFRFTFRAMQHGDFLEGIRAAIIDKDRKPKWRHADWQALRGADVLRMTLPLGKDAFTLEDRT